MRNVLNDLISVVLSSLCLVALLLGAIDYNMDSYEMEAIALTRGANRNGWSVDPLIGINPRGIQIPILLTHDRYLDSVLGHVTQLHPGVDELRFEAILHAGEHQVIIDRIVNGDLVYVSIGYTALKYVGDVVVDADLNEISIVVVPADPGAVILSIERRGLWYYLKRAITLARSSPS